MKTLLIFVLMLTLLSACQDDLGLHAELIPGDYTGSLIYGTSLEGSFVPQSSPDLSKIDGFKTTIKKAGSNYVLSFDKSLVYTIPDITVEIIPTKTFNIVTIRTLQGQAYNSIVSPDTYKNQPSNYFSIEELTRVVHCELTLRSNDPDSIYFLQIQVLRIY